MKAGDRIHVATPHYGTNLFAPRIGDEYLKPFPAWVYEVLFVSKRLAAVDPSRRTR